MELRGPILLIFGLILILSPIAILRGQDLMDNRPGGITTVGQRIAACDAASLETNRRRLGCQNNMAEASMRRTIAGGAVFVTARIN